MRTFVTDVVYQVNGCIFPRMLGCTGAHAERRR